LALIGDAGCGKSTLMEELVQRHIDPFDPNTRKVVYCTLDPLPELRVSQRALLTALGVPPDMSLFRPRTDRDDLIGRALRELGTRLVVFDETSHMHNLRRGIQGLRFRPRIESAWSVRESQVSNRPLGFEQTIRREAQLETRFSIVRIPRWTVGPAFQQFLTSYEQSIPLRCPSGLGSLAMQEALLRESANKQQIAGITQGITQVLEHAAIESIRSGLERITLKTLSAWRDGFDTQPASKPAKRLRNDKTAKP
jgi:hypothetical protein